MLDTDWQVIQTTTAAYPHELTATTQKEKQRWMP